MKTKLHFQTIIEAKKFCDICRVSHAFVHNDQINGTPYVNIKYENGNSIIVK